MDGEWVSAGEAWKLVNAASNWGAAKAICSRAADGILKARARRVVFMDTTQDNSEIPAQFWWARGEAALEQNWEVGDFETWIDRAYFCRAYGVEFLRSDIEDMLPPGAVKRPFRELLPGNYAPALRCLTELAATLECGESEAEQVILRHCRAGLVPARCEEMQLRHRDQYGETESTDSNIPIPDWFWEKCLGHDDTLLNWHSGRFAGHGILDDGEYRAILTGVEFEVGAIIDAERSERLRRNNNSPPAGPVESVPEPERKGARRLKDPWADWVAELVFYIHGKGFPAGEGSQGQGELISAVADALAERGIEALSRTTVQPVVQAVLDRYRSAE